MTENTDNDGLEMGQLVVYDVEGYRTIGTLEGFPSETQKEYTVTDLLFDARHTVPEQQFIRPPNPGECFRAFVVQTRTSTGDWKDDSKHKTQRSAESRRDSVSEDSRIITETIRI